MSGGSTAVELGSYAAIAGAGISAASTANSILNKPAAPKQVAAPAIPAAASPARDADSTVQASGANQRAAALAAAGAEGAGSNPDLAGAPTTAKSNLLGPS